MAGRSRQRAAGACPLCQREVSHWSVHHLVPRARGGRDGPTVLVCADCHDAIHEMFTNRELAERFATLDALLTDERFARHVRWLSRQGAERRFPTRTARQGRRH